MLTHSTNVKNCWLLVEKYFHVEEKAYSHLQAREIETFFTSLVFITFSKSIFPKLADQ